MSFFSVLGKIGKGAVSVVKGVGITAGNVVGNYVGVGSLGSNINSALSKNNATAGVPTASIDGAGVPMTSQPNVISPTPSIWGSIVGAIDNFGGFFSGKNHVQVDVNTGVGGRVGDSTTSSGLPSWLPIAGLAAGGLLLFTSMSGKRR